MVRGRLAYSCLFHFFRSYRALVRQAIKEIYSQDAARAKAAVAERKKNGTIEMSAAKMAAMMDETGEGEAGGDVPMVKVSIGVDQIRSDQIR